METPRAINVALNTMRVNRFFGTTYTLEQIADMDDPTLLMMLAVISEYNGYRAYKKLPPLL
jgi:hypothetical protein